MPSRKVGRAGRRERVGGNSGVLLTKDGPGHTNFYFKSSSLKKNIYLNGDHGGTKHFSDGTVYLTPYYATFDEGNFGSGNLPTCTSLLRDPNSFSFHDSILID